MVKYIKEHKPFAIVMGPPCTSYASWSHLNRAINHKTWETSREIGVKLASISAQVAMYQLREGRHFLIENPAGSEIFYFELYRELWDTGKVVSINFPQCAFGFRVQNIPIHKNTKPWASSHLLLEPFHGSRCCCRHYGKLEDKNRTKLAQVWPYQMCLAIVEGVCNLIRATDWPRIPKETLSYPTRRKGQLPKFVPGTTFDCPACIGRRFAGHPDHTRNYEPPLRC